MAETTNQEFTITRTFNAPRDLVWRAWTEEKQLAKWWGPKGFAIIASRMDLRPGGMYHYGLRSSPALIAKSLRRRRFYPAKTGLRFRVCLI